MSPPEHHVYESRSATPSTTGRSTSTIVVGDLEAKVPSSRRSLCSLLNNNWAWEIWACVASVGALLAIVALLYHYHKRPVPDWPYGTTINSVLSWIIQLFNALILGTVASCISQSAWIHFSTTDRPLSDMTSYDWASRRFAGCVAFAWRSRMGHLASLGALITIFAIGSGPFVQQMTNVGNSLVPGNTSAALGRGQAYTETLVDMGSFPTPGMMASIYSSIFSCSSTVPEGELDNPLSLLPTVPRDCPTGECHFPPFQTLAVCSSCTDISSTLTSITHQACQPGTTQYDYSLPNGMQFNVSDVHPTPDPLFKTSTRPLTPQMRMSVPAQIPSYGASQILDLTEIRIPNPSNLSHATATHCSLYWCVNTYSSLIRSGCATETLLDSYHNPSATYTGPLHDRLDLTPPPIPTLNLTSSPSPAFTVSRHASAPITKWLHTKMRMSNYDPYVCDHTPSKPTLLSINPHNATEFDRPITVSSLRAVFSRVATGMTIRVRQMDWGSTHLTQDGVPIGSIQGIGAARGTTMRWEVQLHVRWAWIALPVFLAVLTMGFLVITVARTRGAGLDVWKFSPLPLLCAGLEGEVQRGIRGVGDPVGMERAAGEVRVQFKRGGEYPFGERWRLKAV